MKNLRGFIHLILCFLWTVTIPSVAQENADQANRALFIDDYRSAMQIRYDHFRAESKEINSILFILREDSGGLAFLSELREAARRGIKVKVILDDYGSVGTDHKQRLTEAMVKHLENEGVEVKIFHRVDKRALLDPSRYLKRNHEKILIFRDHQSFIISDRNGSGKYFGIAKKDKFLSRDLYVQGAETMAVEKHFEDLYSSPAVEKLTYKVPVSLEEIKAAEQRLDDAQKVIASTMVVKKDNPTNLWKEKAKPVKKITFLGDHGHSVEGKAHKKLLELIKNSQSKVVIESPYVILNNKNQEAIKSAMKNGSRVEIITNNSNLTDEVWVPGAADDDLRKLAASGIDVYENAESRIFHTKSYIVDDKYVFFGSNNFDNRSQNWDREASVLIEDQEFAKDLETLIERDKSLSRKLDLARPSYRKDHCIRWALSNLLRPIL